MSGRYSTGVHEEEIGGPVYDQRLASRLLRYLKPYWRQALLAISLLAAISLLEVAGPYLTKIAIDRYVALG